jgi:hypothetical protein
MKKVLIVGAIIVAASFFWKKHQEKKDLYDKIEIFVDNLETTYTSYGLIGGVDEKLYTEDYKYQIFPIGRLINVKALGMNTEGEDYEALKEDLKEHFEGDNRVNDVYICGAGTVMVDCRN